MAELEGGGGGHKKGGKKPHGKKLSTRVDFTPMVDLGFLLITFFMLTTSMNKPKTMEINMPVQEGEKTPVPASQTMSIILTENDKVVYYFRDSKTGDPLTPQITDYSAGGIRSAILKENTSRNPNIDSIEIYKKMYRSNLIDEKQMKKHISFVKEFKDGLIVIIKADDKAKFKNLVDILDEMLICNVGRYAIVNLEEPEKELIKQAQTTLAATNP